MIATIEQVGKRQHRRVADREDYYASLIEMEALCDTRGYEFWAVMRGLVERWMAYPAPPLQRPPRGVGQQRSFAKLNEVQVRIIRRCHASQRFLARVFGVGQTAIGRVQRGSHWQTPTDGCGAL